VINRNLDGLGCSSSNLRRFVGYSRSCHFICCDAAGISLNGNTLLLTLWFGGFSATSGNHKESHERQNRHHRVRLKFFHVFEFGNELLRIRN
jgi:hypothetical protein